MNTEKIMGIEVDNITYNDIISELPDYLNSSKKMTAISVNPQIVVESQQYPEVIDFIKKSTHRIPDGIGIVLVSKLTRGSIKQRLTGFELMNKFLEYANLHGNSVFLYGAKEKVLQDAVSKIEIKYPSLSIVGAIDGYTSLSDSQIIKIINEVKPDFLFVALGFPKQEQWLANNYQKLNVSVFQDVGGSIDVLSGHVKRAPEFFLKTNLEWFYRSLRYPQRINRIFQLPIFVCKSLWWYLHNN